MHRLAVGTREHVQDVQGQNVARAVHKDLGLEVDGIRLIKIFLVDGLDDEQMEQAVDKGFLHDPVMQEVSLAPLARDFDWILEVGYRPGVTDNEGRVARDTLMTGLKLERSQAPDVFTAIQYLIQGTLSRADVQRMATDLLANELIERYAIKSAQEWSRQAGFQTDLPRVTGASSDAVEVVALSSLGDEELKQVSQDRVLALSLDELNTIRDYYRRAEIRQGRQERGLPPEPTDAELEVLAQTWSEHCKHKIFNARIDYADQDTGRGETITSLFSTYIQQSTAILRQRAGEDDVCLSVFKDNAGVIRFDEEHSVCIKVETHNSPSALDPYGGALTGIVGVNRDPMGTGLGANLLCNTDVFCFASPFHDEPLPPRLLHPHRVMEGVRRGVEHGGNQSGIPTVNGGLIFDPRFLGKPLVFCGTVGMMPAQIQGRPSHEKKARPGDRVIMVGGRVGKDGIHGATFSSEALHAGSPATAVQIGDPITQRKMYDFLIRARDLGLFNAITDNGAGGLSSSVGEMAEDTGGCEVDLSLVPLKYDGLVPWEILLSEAQERMTVAVPEDCLPGFLAMASDMDVEATDLGSFTNSGFFRVWFRDRLVAELEMDFLHHGLPRMELVARWSRPDPQPLEIPDEVQADPGRFLRTMLGRLNICSRESVIRQYDHEVQGGSVIKPLVGDLCDGPGDAAVLRPVLDRSRGLVVSNGICPRYSDLDTYWMMACAVDEAIRNAVAVGGDLDHMAGVDNFCWCDPVQSDKTPDGHFKLAQLVRANKALAHFCLGFGVPCVSGKDSMKNDYSMDGFKISIPPTVLFSIISVIPDVGLTVSSDLKQPGEVIFLLGLTRKELGRSELASEIQSKGGDVPQVDLISARTRYQSMQQAFRSGLVTACHDLSDGGLGVALAEMCIGGGLGADVNLDLVPVCGGQPDMETVLYSESPSRLLVTVSEDRAGDFEELFQGQAMARVGTVRAEPMFEIRCRDRVVLQEEVQDLSRAWKSTLAAFE